LSRGANPLSKATRPTKESAKAGSRFGFEYPIYSPFASTLHYAL
jgi:hypothetical protein